MMRTKGATCADCHDRRIKRVAKLDLRQDDTLIIGFAQESASPLLSTVLLARSRHSLWILIWLSLQFEIWMENLASLVCWGLPKILYMMEDRSRKTVIR